MVNSEIEISGSKFMSSFEVFDTHCQTAHKRKVPVKKILGCKLVQSCWQYRYEKMTIYLGCSLHDIQPIVTLV